MHRLKHFAILALAGAGFASAAQADTSDVTWQNRVMVEKSGAHCSDDPNCFNRYHSAGPAGGAGQAGRSHRVRDPRRASTPTSASIRPRTT